MIWLFILIPFELFAIGLLAAAIERHYYPELYRDERL